MYENDKINAQTASSGLRVSSDSACLVFFRFFLGSSFVGVSGWLVSLTGSVEPASFSTLLDILTEKAQTDKGAVKR